MRVGAWGHRVRALAMAVGSQKTMRCLLKRIRREKWLASRTWFTQVVLAAASDSRASVFYKTRRSGPYLPVNLVWAFFDHWK